MKKTLFVLLLMAGTLFAQDMVLNEDKITTVYGADFCKKLTECQDYIDSKQCEDETEADDCDYYLEEDDESATKESSTNQNKSKLDKLIKETVKFIKLKEAVDKKIKDGRKDISSLRKRLYNIKRAEDAEHNNQYRHGYHRSSSSIRRDATYRNSEKIDNYKIVIPQLVSFSNQLKALIDDNLAIIKDIDKEVIKTNKTISEFKNRFIAPSGSEDVYDSMDRYYWH